MNRSATTFVRCFIPTCKNTTTNSRDKLFVFVREPLKKKWCEQANVEYKPEKRMLCCEDHLNLEEDIEGYKYFKLKKLTQLRLKSTAKLRGIPQKEKTLADSMPTLTSLLLLPIQNSSYTLQNQINSTEIKEQPQTTVVRTETTVVRPTVTSASTQHMKIDASTQSYIENMDKSTSTWDLTKPLLEFSPVSYCEITPSPSLNGVSSDAETNALCKDLPDYNARNQILYFISNKPKAYIGLPEPYFWLIKHIATQSVTKVTELDIIITLFVIKFNDPVTKICDQFEISRHTYTDVMHTGTQVLAQFFQSLVYMPTLLQIKKQNQTLPFKRKYSNVCLLLDILEIKIERPNNPTRQAQTWSQHKNAYTVKYLIGSTPNGFVSFVSMGYGGRISDKALVEKSGIVNVLPDNAVIMADRECFKDIEALLMVKRIKLLRPPNVYASNKKTKVVATLKVHIERVKRRIREFRFLKPHSVVRQKNVSYLGKAVLIACGLINLRMTKIKIE